ncbi:hypothetical protein G9A89_010236 [Geosiphon pyriformis]|nr:hypothetical protein G9A89_010236 [Geosiphon pyriformis]
MIFHKNTLIIFLSFIVSSKSVLAIPVENLEIQRDDTLKEPPYYVEKLDSDLYEESPFSLPNANENIDQIAGVPSENGFISNSEKEETFNFEEKSPFISPYSIFESEKIGLNDGQIMLEENKPVKYPLQNTFDFPAATDPNSIFLSKIPQGAYQQPSANQNDTQFLYSGLLDIFNNIIRKPRTEKTEGTQFNDLKKNLTDEVVLQLTIHASYANLPYCFPHETIDFTPEIKVSIVGLNAQEKTLIVSFRGSDLGPDSRTAGRTKLIDYIYAKNAKIHRGYWEAIKDSGFLYGGIIPFIKKLIDRTNINLVLTGHDAGGAYAVLVGLELKRDSPKKGISIYTYGQSRLGNREFAQYVNNQMDEKFQIYRVVYGNDSTAHVPSMKDGYMHHGTEYWIVGPKGPVYECPIVDDRENEACANSVVADKNGPAHDGPYFGVVMKQCNASRKA